MKKLLTFSFLVLLFAFSGCKKHDDEPEPSGVSIKGTIPGAGEGKKENTDSLTLDQTEKILVCNGVNYSSYGLDFEFVDVTEESFSVSANLGGIVALVFLTANYEYIGTLSTQGLNLLPLGRLSGGENTTIDLSTLTLVGTSVFPAHDPFGNEIIITQDELDALKDIDSYFEAITQNIDTDNDGIADFSSNRQLFVDSRFQIEAGNYGINSTPPQIISTSTDNMQYGVTITGGEGYGTPAGVTLSGPATNPYGDIQQFYWTNNPGGPEAFAAGFHRATGLAFEDGIYTVSIDGNNHSLSFSNIDAKYNLMYVLPTLHTNNEGKLISITLEYQMPDGSSIAPENIMANVMVQFNSSQFVQFYSTPRLTHIQRFIDMGGWKEGIYTFNTESPVDISALDNIDVAYEDVLGNDYFIKWR